MAQNKQGKMANLINYRMRVTLADGRQMTGSMLAFDKHMNLVLADTEEFRRVKSKPGKSAAPPPPGSSAPALVETEQKRTLGLTIVRGTHIISLSVESPPPADPSARLGTSAPGGGAAAVNPTLGAGPGISRPAQPQGWEQRRPEGSHRFPERRREDSGHRRRGFLGGGCPEHHLASHHRASLEHLQEDRVSLLVLEGRNVC
ncbi:MAG: hypothetical protein M1832_003289 [Thelocarpon impressellum]|nr:MAG: hypothetical protein M1832_003289 [Thelocarpon impressellum]